MCYKAAQVSCLCENDVLDLVEGRIDEGRRTELLAHVQDCAPCRIVVGHAATSVMPSAEEGPAGVALGGLPKEGDTIGRYRVLRRLGAGAMGVVLAAEHVDLRRQVALKIILPGAAGTDDQLRARLIREARAASAIRHPHVVAVHDVLTLDDGSPMMVMDLLEGESLRRRLERGRLTVSETLTVARQLLSALEAAHALGVVHRDLKPDNIFLARENGGEMVKIVDFGIAKLTAVDGPAQETAGLTKSGMLIGTPHYMAPEQAFADGTIDARADLWAVGVVLYEALSGSRPFDGDNVGQVLKRLAQLSLRPIDEVVRGLPKRLSVVIGLLLSERALRPKSAAEVRDLLDGVEDQGELELMHTAPGAVALEAADASWIRSFSSRSAWPMVGMAALLPLGWMLLAPLDPVALRQGAELRLVSSERRPLAAALPAQTPSVIPSSKSAPPPHPPAGRRTPSPAKSPPPPTPSASGPVPEGPGAILTHPPF
jgi:serine/threonine-protein kinase